MSEEYCVLRHKAWGETSLELVILKKSCRAGVIHAAGPRGFSFLEGLVVRTRAGWYQACQQSEDGSTWLNPWHALVLLEPGKYALLLEHAMKGV